jgi:hypothetical protein
VKKNPRERQRKKVKRGNEKVGKEREEKNNVKE